MIKLNETGNLSISLVEVDISSRMTNHFNTFGLRPSFRNLYLHLRLHSIEFDWFIFGKESEKTFEQSILTNKYDILFVHIDNHIISNLLNILKNVKNTVPSMLIILFGYLPSVKYKEFLKDSIIDYCIVGSGEYVIYETCIALKSGRNLEHTAGLIGRQDVNHERIRTSHKVISFPLEIKKLGGKIFNDASICVLAQNVVSIESSQGCPYNCSFCRTSSFYRKYYQRSYLLRNLENVIAEIEYYYRNHGIRHFKFFDSNFLGTEKGAIKRTTGFAHGLARKGLDITFEIHARSNCISDDVILPLKEAGLVHIAMGIESMIQTQLNRFQKNVTVETHQKAINTLQKHSIPGQAYTMLLDPLSTVDELKENLDRLIIVSRSILVLVHERIILYSTTPYYDRYRHQIKNYDFFPIALGTAVDYRFNDPVLQRIFNLFEKISLIFKKESEAMLHYFFGVNISTLGKYRFFKYVNHLRLKLLREILDPLVTGVPSPYSILDRFLKSLQLELTNHSQEVTDEKTTFTIPQ